MQPSVVIIARNEAHILGETLRSLSGLTDDIIVVDSGSTDATMDIAKAAGARVVEISWTGYGAAKNRGTAEARYDWILSLDADEMPDETLKNAIAQLNDTDPARVYQLDFHTYFCKKRVRFGEWGRDRHIRLFNKELVHWDRAAVHESLVFPEGIKVRSLPGHIRHYTVDSMEEYLQKTEAYAKLNARKYALAGKKASTFKKWLSPAFSFVMNYLVKGGFLDGKTGWILARNNSRYVYLKYHYLGLEKEKAGLQ